MTIASSDHHPDQATAPAQRRGLRKKIRPWPIALATLLLACLAIVVATTPTSSSDQALHPHSATPRGTQALAQLLQAHGVKSSTTRSLDEVVGAPQNTTVVVVKPQWLDDQQLQRLATSKADLVLVQPEEAALQWVGPLSATSTLPGSAMLTYPTGQCNLSAGQRAGSVAVDDAIGYDIGKLPPSNDRPPTPTMQQAGLTPLPRAPRANETLAHTPTQWCYPVESGLFDSPRSAFLVVQLQSQATTSTNSAPTGKHSQRTITALGSSDLLTNASLPQQGNASLAMNLLGAHERVVWYLPEPSTAGQQDLTSVLPPGVTFAVMALLLALVVLALVQGRRLGPVIDEPLPVVVRAAETAEGRARLYHRANARQRAAEALRRQARSQLRTRYHLGHTDDPQALIAALSRTPAATDQSKGTHHTEADSSTSAGLNAAQAHQMLYGPAPQTDEQLVALAQALHQLAPPHAFADSAPQAPQPAAKQPVA